MDKRELNKLVEEGTNYLLGNSVEQNKLKALELFEEASNNGSFMASYNIACMYYFGDGVDKDLEKSLYYFEKGASQGDKESLYHAGEVAMHLGKNDLGYKYIKEASEKKSLGAMLTYGELLLNDNKVNEALEIIKKASAMGNGNASLFLGHIYRDGKYVEKNLEKAFEYYLESAKLRVNEAEEIVSKCYREGIGTKIDLEKADYYLKMSKIPYED